MKSGSLRKSKLQLSFFLTTICLCLSVRSARDLIVRVKRTGGPFAQAVIGARRFQKLNREKSHQEEEKTMPQCAEHYRLPHIQVAHRTMMSTTSAISIFFTANRVRVADRQAIPQRWYTTNSVLIAIMAEK